MNIPFAQAQQVLPLGVRDKGNDGEPARDPVLGRAGIAGDAVLDVIAPVRGSAQLRRGAEVADDVDGCRRARGRRAEATARVGGRNGAASEEEGGRHGQGAAAADLESVRRGDDVEGRGRKSDGLTRLVCVRRTGADNLLRRRTGRRGS